MNDDDLKRAFAELRAHDRRRAPSFAAVWERARSRPPRRTITPVRIAAAAAVLAVGAGAATLLLRHRASPIVAIADWSAPSDVLLRLPGVPALDSLPDATASLARATTMTATAASPTQKHSRRDTT